MTETVKILDNFVWTSGMTNFPSVDLGRIVSGGTLVIDRTAGNVALSGSIDGQIWYPILSAGSVAGRRLIDVPHFRYVKATVSSTTTATTATVSAWLVLDEAAEQSSYTGGTFSLDDGTFTLNKS